jgi:hypothetical protein
MLFRYPALNAFVKKFSTTKLSSLVKYGEDAISTLEAWKKDEKNKVKSFREQCFGN